MQAIWKLLDKLDTKQKDTCVKNDISEERWTKYFTSLFNNPLSNGTLPPTSTEKGPLDFEISKEELELCSYILKKGKAPGLDRISYEMISCLMNVNPEIIRKLFNAILKNPVTIKAWHTSMISPIHKKGSKINPDNYRGISLISCLAKFFLTILNQRLTKFALERKILSKAQFGFTPGYRTSDALLILHNLIEYYCKKNKEKIFGCFVDFHKAFDSIPRYTLFQKLLNNNITGNFYNILINLYTEDKACVKIGNNISNPFVINQGVKQGCILSPTLFNIFLSDLEINFEDLNAEPLEYSQGEKLSCIMWADDLLLLSKSQIGLQNMLHKLKIYTDNNGLSVNIEKTKVMIFNKTGRHMRRNFKLGEVKLETTRKYKYLGFMITPSGEINTGLCDLKDRALRAFIKMKNKPGEMFQKHPLITLKLYESLIKPILLYASDFWGILKLPKNNPIETLHHTFCKHLLGVQKQTTNIGVLLELGQIPLRLHAKTNAIKNWERISTNKTSNSTLTKSYIYSLTHNLAWPMAIKTSLSEIGMMNLFLNNRQQQNIHRKFLQRICDIFHQNALAEIREGTSKLRTYSLLKTSIGLESYLHTLRNTHDRIQLTKIRLSNHPLMIEKGRHQSIEKYLRFCPFCKNKIEDEIHFLTECKCFKDLRKELYDNVSRKTRNFTALENTEKFRLLMSNNNLTHLTAKYISQTLWIREFLLGKHKNCL